MARIHNELALVKEIFELAQKYGEHEMPLRHVVKCILRRCW